MMERIRAVLSQMSLEQQIAQVMAIGFDGASLQPELRHWVASGVGGVILFARNVESPAQVARLANTLQAAARAAGHPGLMLAIDQEGGRVARLTEERGFTEFPSAMALGASGDPENARLAARAMASEMRAVGINADFAPVLDVNNNTDNPVIGTRSFSADPAVVSAFGAAFLTGLQEEGVLAFGKHFPGHGDTTQDSHFALPVVAHSLDHLETVEFVPFRAAVQAGVGAIMSTHISFPAVEPDGLPATLSARVMTGLIRDRFGFTGLLATDSLEMGALAAAGFTAPQAAAVALRAGADLLLFNHGYEMHRQALQTIAAWVRDGRIPAARLEEAVRRVLEAKERFGMLDPQPADPEKAGGICASPEHRRLSRDLAVQGIRYVQAGQARLPLLDGLVFEISTAGGLGERFGLPHMPVPEDPDATEIDAAVTAAATWAVVMERNRRETSDRSAALVVTLADAAFNHPGQMKLLRALTGLEVPIVAVSLRGTADLIGLPERITALAAFGSNPPALDALAQVLRAKNIPGKMR